MRYPDKAAALVSSLQEMDEGASLELSLAFAHCCSFVGILICNEFCCILKLCNFYIDKDFVRGKDNGKNFGVQ